MVPLYQVLGHKQFSATLEFQTGIQAVGDVFLLMGVPPVKSGEGVERFTLGWGSGKKIIPERKKWRIKRRRQRERKGGRDRVSERERERGTSDHPQPFF